MIAAIRKHGPLSRTDLVRITGYSRPKMTLIVGRLVQQGILREVGEGESQGGRRPRMLHFDTSQGYVAGVDLGATSLSVALAELSGTILERRSEPADVRGKPPVILDRICALLLEMIRARGIDAANIKAIGMGVPGPVQFSTGRLIAPPLMPEWDGYPIPATLRETFPMARIVVDNDVNVMALGELRSGAGVGVENFIVVKIGTGIGGGIVCHGSVYRGSDGCAGDIGHICVDPHGPVCRCGNLGCVEALAAGPAIAARGVEAAQSGSSPLLLARMQNNGGKLAAEDVGAAAAAGDRIAIGIVQDSGRMIGEALAGLVNFFNPRLILLGGGVANIGHQLLASIRQTVLRRSPPLSTKDLRIDYAALKLDAALIGAITLALDHVFV
ncbi:MAG TPA: ROK family protein [Herpetosiphonaceae bacterium]